MRRRLRTIVATGGATALAAGVVVAAVGTASPAAAAGFGASFVVYRVGDSAALGNAASPVFLDTYSSEGVLVSSTALPTETAADQHRLTAVGASESEGLLTLSDDGRFLTLTGYDAAVGATGPDEASLTAAAPASVPRTVGVVYSLSEGVLTVDTSTALVTAGTPYIPRSAITTDGNKLWVVGGNGGVLTTTRGQTAATRVAGTADSNFNQVTVRGGQLFVSGVGDITAPNAADEPQYNRIADNTHLRRVGTGAPTAAGQSLATLPGLPAVTAPASAYAYLPYGIAFEDLTAQGFGSTTLDTAYVVNAADRAGTVEKYQWNGSAFDKKGQVDVDGAFGLAVSRSGDDVTLAVTTPHSVVTIADPSAATSTLSGTPEVLVDASATPNRVFRGIAVAPVQSDGPDNVGPTVTVSAPKAGAHVAPYQTKVAVKGTASDVDGVAGVRVRIDSGSWAKATLSGTSWSASVPLKNVAKGKKHKLTVEATDKASPAVKSALDRTFTFDKVVVPKGAFGPGVVSFNHKNVTKGKFASVSYKGAPKGKGVQSKKKTTATVKIVGRSLKIHLHQGKNAGKVRVTIDGKKKPVIDLYRTKAKDFTKKYGGLKYGTHTVKITALGTKNKKSSGTLVQLGWLKVVL